MIRLSACATITNISARRQSLHKMCQFTTKSKFKWSITTPQSSCCVVLNNNQRPFKFIIHRYLSVRDDGGVNGNDIIESTAATTQWKRTHYQKLEDKFNDSTKDDEEEDVSDDTDIQMKSTSSSSTKQQQPLSIDRYEDVQPMWKEMESRVTKRRSLTLQDRGGVSGRRNVRKSDEDVWLEAGVYNSDIDDDNDDSIDKSK